MRVPIGSLFQSVHLSTHRMLWPYLPRLMPRPIRSIGLGERIAAGLYRPGRDITVVVADCAGLDELAGPGRWSIASIGVTSSPVGDYLRHLGAVRHAAFHRGQGGGTTAAGFDAWHARPVQVTLDLDPDSPVRATSDGLRVRLPRTMSPAEFTYDLERALGSVAVDAVVTSTKGRQRCRDLGLSPDRFIRETEHVVGDRTSKERVEDLFFFRVLLDGDALVAAVETVVAANLTGFVGRTDLLF